MGGVHKSWFRTGRCGKCRHTQGREGQSACALNDQLLSEGRARLSSKQDYRGLVLEKLSCHIFLFPKKDSEQIYRWNSRSFKSDLWGLRFVNQELLIHCLFQFKPSYHFPDLRQSTPDPLSTSQRRLTFEGLAFLGSGKLREERTGNPFKIDSGCLPPATQAAALKSPEAGDRASLILRWLANHRGPWQARDQTQEHNLSLQLDHKPCLQDHDL